MKKKLLLLISLTALFICLLTLSISAVTGSTSNEFGEVQYVDGMSEVKGYDTTSRAVVQNADGTYTTYPAYYVYNGSTGTNMKVDLTKLANATGEPYTKASLIRIEVFANAKLNWTFDSCTGLIEAILPEGVYFHYASFVGCSSLVTIDLPSTVTQIPTDCFSGCFSLESIEIPTTTTSLGARAFQNCNKLSEIKIPEAATGVVPQDFRKITNGKASTPLTLIVPKGCTGINSRYSLDNCNIGTLIFTGDENSAFVKDVLADASGWVSKITYENHCLHYYNNTHTFGEETMGFLGEKYQSDCVYTATCQKCLINTVSRTVCGPMINDLGYSKADYDTTSFTYDIIIYSENIEAYEKETGLTISYGFIVGSYKEGDNGDILDVNNEAKIANAIVLNFAESQYKHLNKYNLKMTGISEELSTKLIYCGGYVNDGSKVTYLGATTDEKLALAVSISTLPEKKEN